MCSPKKIVSAFLMLFWVMTMMVVVKADDDTQHHFVGRLRSSNQLNAASKWWKNIQSNPLTASAVEEEISAIEENIDEEDEQVEELIQLLDVGSMTAAPSMSPSTSSAPSLTPSLSKVQSEAPTVEDTFVDSGGETVVRTDSPSTVPSSGPSVAISSSPSLAPTDEPTMEPSLDPSAVPTDEPSDGPTFNPTLAPSDSPSVDGSTRPTSSVAPSTTPTVSPTDSPTLERCEITASQREAGILAVLDQNADSALIRDPSTPQGKATQWILNEDPRELCPSELKLIQRWVMAVFYYSLEGDQWRLCSSTSRLCGLIPPFRDQRRFLSQFSECDWAGITCNIDDCITEIEFEANGLGGTIPSELGLLTDLALLVRFACRSYWILVRSFFSFSNFLTRYLCLFCF